MWLHYVSKNQNHSGFWSSSCVEGLGSGVREGLEDNPHFKVRETESESGEGICPRTLSSIMAQLDPHGTAFKGTLTQYWRRFLL